MNKTILDLKREVDTIKKTQSEATLEIETLGKKSGTIDASISNRIQEMEDSEYILCEFLCECVTSLRMMPSRSIHLARNFINSFFLIAE